MVLHLGTNMGFKAINLELARLLISNFIGQLEQQSAIYLTEAWGTLKDQPDFHNQAIICSTELSPAAVLKAINEIEYKLGRERKEKWGPRRIDIDIIFYEDEIIKTAQLNIPHPHFRNRNFVLVPLMEICPARKDPDSGLSIAEIANSCKDLAKVESL